MKPLLCCVFVFLLPGILALKDIGRDELYDVTTVYRISGGSDSENYPSIPGCFVGKYCNSWSYTGWITENSGFYPEISNLEKRGSASLQDLPHVIPLPDAGLNIALGEDSFVYIMSGEDAVTADMFVLRCILNNRLIYYKCSKTSDSIGQLPTKPFRRDCTSSDGDITVRGSEIVLNIDYDSNSKVLNVTNVFDGDIIFRKNDEFLSFWKENGIYIGIKTEPSVFRYGDSFSLLELTSNSNALKSNFLNLKDDVCLQLNSFTQSESKLVVSLSDKYESNTIIGEALLTRNKLETWQFISNTSSSLARIVIKGEKNNNTPLLVYNISSCNTDRDTRRVINLSGFTEVHARTNARGLPFLFSDGTIAAPAFEQDGGLPECLPGLESCSWKLNNFKPNNLNVEDLPLLKSGEMNNTQITINELDFKQQTFETREVFTFTPTWISYDRKLKVILTDNKHDITISDIYIFSFESRGSSFYLYKCTGSTYSENVYITDSVVRHCSRLGQQEYIKEFLQENRKIEYTVSMTNGGLAITVKDGGHPLFNMTKLEPAEQQIEITHFSLWTRDMKGYAEGVAEYPVSVLEGGEGSIVSPPVSTQDGRLCASVVYQAGSTGSLDFFLKQEDQFKQKGRLVWSSVVNQWTHELYTWNVSEEADGNFQVLVEAQQLNSSDDQLMIQRLAGCNPEDAEDVLITEQARPITIPQFGIDVAHNLNYRTTENNSCKNGGRMLVWPAGEPRRQVICVCPPGFTGDSCEKGCGFDRFGEDCGGKCSGTTHGCLGMVLCRPGVGCSCAAGYTGPYCKQRCDRNRYGIGCRYKCDFCSGSHSCDVYTGVCHAGCQAGYYPPYCQDYFSYLAKPPRTLSHSNNTLLVTAVPSNTLGQGNPLFYQVQYKENGSSLWNKTVPEQISTVITHLLTDLVAGMTYQVRVVLIDETGESYEGNQVPSTEATLLCIVPGVKDFLFYNDSRNFVHVVSEDVGADAFTVEWKFPAGNATWCHVHSYEVHIKMGSTWRIHTVKGDVTKLRVTHLIPGETYHVKVRQMTRFGPTAFSAAIEAIPKVYKPGYVVDLAVKASPGHGLVVTWLPPKNSGEINITYIVNYQCVRLLACESVSCSTSAGRVSTSSTSVQLANLLPHAVYSIRVTTTPGVYSNIQGATKMSVPGVRPTTAQSNLVNSTNTTLRVHWAPPENCKGINGYPTGYHYQLFVAGQVAPIVVKNTTKLSAEFRDLTPNTEYLIRVFASNLVGWNSSEALEMKLSTRPTTPEAVQDLTAYKRGRRMLGLRWTQPLNTYGRLHSFTVTHQPADGSTEPLRSTVQPQHCPAWPRRFCFTLKNLLQDTAYNITVRARNKEVPEDGEVSTLQAATKEGTPQVPSFLRVSETTNTSISLEWGLPDQINGQLRSFLIILEQTDTYSSSDCCQSYPISEVMVTSERATYEYQMRDLMPLSTYTVSVAAKTISMGPSVTLTAYTRPAPPLLQNPPVLIDGAVLGSPLRVLVNSAANFTGNISGYLLLLADEQSDVQDLLSDDWLSSELQQKIKHPFELAAEFSQNELLTSKELDLHPGQPFSDGHFGAIGIRPLKPGHTYHFVFAMVLEYCGVISVGHTMGSSFQVKE